MTTLAAPPALIDHAGTVQGQLASTVQSFLAGGTALVLLGIAGFILYTSPDGIKALYGSKNALLLSLLLSMSLYFGMASLETDGGSRITGIMRTIFFSFTEILFIWYSWRRSEIVFRQESSDQVMFIAHILMWITTLACLVSPVILLMPQLSDETAYFNAKIAVSTGGLGIFVLDVFFAVSYTRHIFKKTTEVIEFKGEDARATQYYPIIAKFGFCSSASLVFALGFYVGASVISSKSITNPSEVSSYYFLLVLTNLAIFSTAVALVIMKVKLVNASRGRTILNTASK